MQSFNIINAYSSSYPALHPVRLLHRCSLTIHIQFLDIFNHFLNHRLSVFSGQHQTTLLLRSALRRPRRSLLVLIIAIIFGSVCELHKVKFVVSTTKCSIFPHWIHYPQDNFRFQWCQNSDFELCQDWPYGVTSVSVHFNHSVLLLFLFDTCPNAAISSVAVMGGGVL